METRNEIQKQLLVFLLITSLITTGIFIWMFNGAEDSIAAVLPMMYTPGIAAFLTAWIFKVKIGRFGWRFGKGKYQLLAYLLPIIASIIGYGLFWLTKYADISTAEVVNYKWAKMIGFELPTSPIIGVLSKLVIASIFTAIFVFGEEVGWAGFFTPKLRKLYSVPVTSIVVGLYWSIWHYPALIGGFYGYGAPLWIALPGFSLVMIGCSFVRTVLVDKSKSLWTGVLVHTSHNVVLMGIFLEMTKQTGELDIHAIVSETGPVLGIVYILVAVIFWKKSTSKQKTIS